MSFHPVVHSPDIPNSQGCSNHKPEAQNVIQVAYMGGTDSSKGATYCWKLMGDRAGTQTQTLQNGTQTMHQAPAPAQFFLSQS